MIYLNETTFIIPIKIESEDRAINAKITLNYLLSNFQTNIIIYEVSENKKLESILEKIDLNLSFVEYKFIESKDLIFHRTKILNEMLSQVNTPVVVNYDIDILLEKEIYKMCSDKICKNNFDLIYPYFWGNSQKQILYSGRNKIINQNNLNCLLQNDINLAKSEYGHCQFFKTESYINGGMENEGFIGYAPEDQERGYRFKKLGYNVSWQDNYIYHIEHSRTFNSNSSNPKMEDNNKLFEYIKSLSEEDLKKYYLNAEYKKKYFY